MADARLTVDSVLGLPNKEFADKVAACRYGIPGKPFHERSHPERHEGPAMEIGSGADPAQVGRTSSGAWLFAGNTTKATSWAWFSLLVSSSCCGDIYEMASSI